MSAVLKAGESGPCVLSRPHQQFNIVYFFDTKSGCIRSLPVEQQRLVQLGMAGLLMVKQ